MFQFYYNKKHYLTHPWVWVGDLFSNLKWAWQRVFRGWDDRVPWSVDWHICEMMPEWLRVLKSGKTGFPAQLYSESDTHEETCAKWIAIIDEMIVGFEAGYQILNGDFPENNKAFEASWDIKGFEESFQVYSDAIDRDKLKAEEDKALKEYERGMELFSKYFFALWD